METKAWKNLFRLFGNCTGYFILASRGASVQDDEMTTPFSGILLREITDILQLHKPEHDWMLPVQMMLFAEKVGEYEDAVDWATRTKVGSGSLGIGAQSLLAGALVARDFGERQYIEVVRASDVGDLDEARLPEGLAQADDDRLAQQAARRAARLNIVALAFELARVGLHERSRAEAVAQMASALSREVAARHDGSLFWLGTAAVFDALQKRELSWQELWRKAVDARQQGDSDLHVMYGIAASAVAGPTEAVQIQLQIVPYVERLFSPTLLHFTVGRFVPEFWLWAFDQYAIGFGQLNRTRLAVTKAIVLEDKSKIHKILDAVALSVGLVCPNDVQRWLDSSSST
jgi:hypothetical protein